MDRRIGYPFLVFIGMVASALYGCAHSPGDFSAFVEKNPESVFGSGVDARLRTAVAAYREHLSIAPDEAGAYGDSVRNYSLAGKSAPEIAKDMERLGCEEKRDFVREPARNLPIVYRGKSVPLVMYLCPDGGVVRVKPDGDPTNRFRPEPHASKALRFPFDAKYENFADEVVKIDNSGNAIPKSRADLFRQDLVDGWSRDAHTDLRVD